MRGADVTLSRQVDALTGRFSNCRILLLGDVMLDEYVWGDVRRVSPEAPVPVVEFQHESYSAGGAANVAANMASLGARVSLAGIA